MRLLAVLQALPLAVVALEVSPRAPLGEVAPALDSRAVSPAEPMVPTSLVKRACKNTGCKCLGGNLLKQGQYCYNCIYTSTFYLPEVPCRLAFAMRGN